MHHFEPSRVITDLNSVLRGQSDEDDHFCSVVFARVELDACGAWVSLSVGGHPLPYLVRASGLTEFRGTPHSPAGMFDAFEPADDRVGLGPGDALVFYTDGITEARNRAGRQFGRGRLADVLGANAGAPAEDIATAILEAAQEWSSGPFTDDVAIMVIRVPSGVAGDRMARVVRATGVAAEQLKPPGHSRH